MPYKKDTAKKPTIKPLKNGPYLVRFLGKLTDYLDKPLPSTDNITLCRCGGSKNKPFCDGTHVKNGFDSARLTDGQLDRRLDYSGRNIIIHDNRGICSHAGFCTDCLPEVWRMGEEPWIYPNAASPEKIIETIYKCPSGALSYSQNGIEHRDHNRKPEIFVSKNGPYRVRGLIELDEKYRAQGASFEHYTLCRCGCSRNKPFCDGSHWRVDFRDDE